MVEAVAPPLEPAPSRLSILPGPGIDPDAIIASADGTGPDAITAAADGTDPDAITAAADSTDPDVITTPADSTDPDAITAPVALDPDAITTPADGIDPDADPARWMAWLGLGLGALVLIGVLVAARIARRSTGGDRVPADHGGPMIALPSFSVRPSNGAQHTIVPNVVLPRYVLGLRPRLRAGVHTIRESVSHDITRLENR